MTIPTTTAWSPSDARSDRGQSFSLITALLVCTRCIAVIVVMTAAAVASVGVACLPRAAWRRRAALPVVRTIARALLTALGIALEQRGPRPVRGALLVANHLSWLDIIATLTQWPCAFVAKREVRSWPIIGALGEAIGVIWIDRTRARDLLRVIPVLRDALVEGRTVLLFPEGTTTGGYHLLPFRSALFEAVVRNDSPVMPMAIGGTVRDGDVQALTWTGDETLVRNIVRLAALRGAQLSVHVGAPQLAFIDRKVTARVAQRAVLRRCQRIARMRWA